MKRSQYHIALYMLAVFLSGAVVGGFAHRLYMVKSVTAEPRRPSKQEFRRMYTDQIRSRLNLDESQSAKLNQILDLTDQRFRTFRETHKAEMDGIHQEQVREINAMLNESQRSAYEEFRKEREKKRREFEGKP